MKMALRDKRFLNHDVVQEDKKPSGESNNEISMPAINQRSNMIIKNERNYKLLKILYLFFI